MPYVNHDSWTEYQHEEYPKTLTKVVDGKVVHLVYPHGHERQGEYVVVHNSDEEAAAADVGVFENNYWGV